MSNRIFLNFVTYMYKYKFCCSSCISRIRRKRLITYFERDLIQNETKKYETRNVTEIMMTKKNRKKNEWKKAYPVHSMSPICVRVTRWRKLIRHLVFSALKCGGSFKKRNKMWTKNWKQKNKQKNVRLCILYLQNYEVHQVWQRCSGQPFYPPLQANQTWWLPGQEWQFPLPKLLHHYHHLQDDLVFVYVSKWCQCIRKSIARFARLRSFAPSSTDPDNHRNPKWKRWARPPNVWLSSKAKFSEFLLFFHLASKRTLWWRPRDAEPVGSFPSSFPTISKEKWKIQNLFMTNVL